MLRAAPKLRRHGLPATLLGREVVLVDKGRKTAYHFGSCTFIGKSYFVEDATSYVAQCQATVPELNECR